MDIGRKSLGCVGVATFGTGVMTAVFPLSRCDARSQRLLEKLSERCGEDRGTKAQEPGQYHVKTIRCQW